MPFRSRLENRNTRGTLPGRVVSSLGCDSGFSLVEALGVLMILAVLSAVVSPLSRNMLTYARLSGDAHALSNAVAVAKMRASSSFSRARLFVVLSSGSYRIEVWRKTGTPGWDTEGSSVSLSTGDVFGFGGVATPPPNTQGTIALAPECIDDVGDAISGTSCIVFNSRGLPIDSTGTPTGVDAYYLTDGATVYGINVGATGTMRLWRTPANATPDWTLQ
jgi:type II secretory pathway pseudopilin PulG